MNAGTGKYFSDLAIMDEPDFRGSPERNLIMAVLERAILDFVSTHAKDREEATAWFEDDSDAEFSFKWVCSELDLDPERVAKDIYALPRRTSRHMAPWYIKNHPEQMAA